MIYQIVLYMSMAIGALAISRYERKFGNPDSAGVFLGISIAMGIFALIAMVLVARDSFSA